MCNWTVNCFGSESDVLCFIYFGLFFNDRSKSYLLTGVLLSVCGEEEGEGEVG